MNRHSIKFVGALTAGCLATFGLAACGSSGGGSSSVTLGGILPLTGDFSNYGGPIKDAAQMAVDRVNEAGGVVIDGKKYTVKLKVWDDATTPAKSVPKIFPQAVLRDKVPFLITAWNSANVAPFLKSNPVPTVDVLAATYKPAVNTLNDNIFLLRPYTPNIIPGVATYFAEKYKVKRMAYVGPNEPFANGQLESLKQTVGDNGISLVKQVVYPASSSELTSFMQSVLSAKPDALYVGGSTQEVAPELAQLHQLGYDKPIAIYTGITPDQASDLIGKNSYNDVMANVHEFEGVTPQTNPSATANQFGKDFQAAYNTYGIDLTQWAYDVVWIAKAAMEKAGTVTDPAKIREALTQLSVPDKTITGWIPQDGDHLFSSDRQATSLSVGLDWSTKDKTWAPAIYFTSGADQKVTVVNPKKSQ